MARKKKNNDNNRNPRQCQASPQQPSSSTLLDPPSSSVAEFEEAVAQTWESFVLPVYDGRRDCDALDEWIWKMESFFFATRKTEPQKLFYAANQLTGLAHSWWRSFVNPGDKAIWECFKAMLKDTFGGSKEEIQRPRGSDHRDSKSQWLNRSVENASKYGDREHNKRDGFFFSNPQTVQEAMVMDSNLEQMPISKGPDNTAVTRTEANSFVKSRPKSSIETAGTQKNEFRGRPMASISSKDFDIAPVTEEEESSYMEPCLKNSTELAASGQNKFRATAMALDTLKESDRATVTEEKERAIKFSVKNTNEDRMYPDTKNYLVMPTGEDCYRHCIKGKLLGRDITIATANNCSHNFIAVAIAMEMNLQTQKCRPFILDCNGKNGILLYDDFIPCLTFSLGNEMMTDCIDFYIINMTRYDMVLGKPWLSKQRMIPYQGSSMKLLLQGKWVEIPEEEDAE